MRLIAHLSDLHFGRHDPAVVEALLSSIAGTRPHLVVISGDLTQRARRSQFAAAREFLTRIRVLDIPVLAVPGNHDVPLYDVTRRFLRPMARFRRYISADELPLHADDEIAVLGINTARSLAFADGRISHWQMAHIRKTFAAVGANKPKLLVTHHPLVPLPWGRHGAPLKAVGRAESALDAVADAGVHLLLAGHHHRQFAGAAATFVTADASILVVQAGTSTSTRTRDETNSFNLIAVEPGILAVAAQGWTGNRFELLRTDRYRLVDGRWHAYQQADVTSDRDRNVAND